MSGRDWAAWRARIPLLVTIPVFLRALGAVYSIAFVSLGAQAAGLIGPRGILPFADYLAAARDALGGSAYWQVPTVLWLRPTYGALAAVWIAGAASALWAIFGPWRRAALAVCLVLWISLCSVGQDFLSFQWDILLAEAGFLALFADGSAIVVWLFRWLLFRLMFLSGVVKLMSHDRAWRNLTALYYHYETQPLPTPLAWYMHQLPLGFHKASTLFVFFGELCVPFAFFAPKPIRRWAGLLTVLLQVLILSTGNYTFFNLLTILLCMWLWIEPRPMARWRPAYAPLAGFIGIVSGLLMLEAFNLQLPPGGAAVLHEVAPLRIVNSYGLFAAMTTERPEIIVEGSADGIDWKAYEFLYKPGDLFRAPPIVAPHQPRLDWQMWFAALGDYQQNRWFVNFAVRLLQGEPAVLRLLRHNPFPRAPPRYIRARVYNYRFTRFGDRAWWRREEKGEYLPPVSLRQ